MARYRRVVSSDARIELADSTLTVQSREIARDVKPRRVTFTGAESACRGLREFFDCPVECGASAEPVLVRANQQILGFSEVSSLSRAMRRWRAGLDRISPGPGA